MKLNTIVMEISGLEARYNKDVGASMQHSDDTSGLLTPDEGNAPHCESIAVDDEAFDVLAGPINFFHRQLSSRCRLSSQQHSSGKRFMASWPIRARLFVWHCVLKDIEISSLLTSARQLWAQADRLVVEMQVQSLVTISKRPLFLPFLWSAIQLFQVEFKNKWVTL